MLVLFHSRWVLVCTLLAFFGGEVLNAAGASILSASQTHSIALQGGGTVCGVGRNEYGELGDGTAENRSTPVTAAQLTGMIAVSTGGYHSLGVKTGGTVWSWGNNVNGQLGDGTTIDKPTPISVPGLTGMTGVAAGVYHSVALKSNGTVWAWGENSYGQLGDGTTTDKSSPVQVIALTGVTAVATGQNHSLALKSDGTVWDWGYNGFGQLGDGTSTNRTGPVQVASLTGVVAIAAGADHSLALKSDGTVWTWGDNGYGQLGDGTQVSRSNIVRAGSLTGIISIAGGDNHSLAIKSDGTAWAWGDNRIGQLGDGTAVLLRLTPIQVSGFTGGTTISAGTAYSVAVKSNGTMWAWGDNTYGQLGNGTTTGSHSPVASSPCASGTFMGPGKSSFANRLTAAQARGLTVKSDGTIWGWGSNVSGELGDGMTNIRVGPVQAAGLTSMAGVSAGWAHSLGLRTDGTVWSWGDNSHGELGDGTTIAKLTPILVPGLTGVIGVSAGEWHNVVVKSDGTVWSWGDNSYGQLGDGTLTGRTSPVQTGTLTGVIAVAVGATHSLALKSDGTVWGWGYNGNAQLGDDTLTNRTSPVQVVNLTGVVAIAAGQNHSLALKSDGTVWAWGADVAAQLGDGAHVNYRAEIVRTADIIDIVAIAGGDQHSLAVRSDGTVWSWGYNGYGQLGDGSNTERLTPVEVKGLNGAPYLTNALAVAGATGFSMALRSNGTIVSWGDNTYDQFGVSTPASSTVPVSGPGWFVTPPVTPLAFYPLTPCRIADTRAGQGKTYAFGPPSLEASVGRDFPILTNACNIPATAQAYSLNITAAPLGPLGFLSVWPVGLPYPGVSTLNSADGSLIANAAIVPAGTNGDITILAGNPTDVIIDINGYFAPASPSGLDFYLLTPCRVADTRAGQGKTDGFGPPSLASYVGRNFAIASGSCTVPTSQAYSLNMTVVPEGPLGFLSAWPTGQPYPGVSTLNAPDGGLLANAAIVPSGTGGDITVLAGNPTDLIIDINGSFAAPGTGGLHFYPATPCRVADTRVGQGKTGAFGPPSLAGYADRDFPILSAGCNIPGTAQAYALNFTAVPQGPLGFLSVWAAGQGYPGVSTLNSSNGNIIANAAIVPAGTGGAITVVAGNPTDLIIDIVGYFAP